MIRLIPICFQDYFQGSMHEMTSWTRLVWETVLTMVEEGSEACGITDNPTTIDCSVKGVIGAEKQRAEGRRKREKRESYLR